jgi:hypothetical protein
MNFVRTFHPVGQGAFYTERHILDKEEDKNFTIVYDCGSSKPKLIEAMVKKAFSKNDEIDVLFISHFHADHINGIGFLKERCNIKRVVMPFIDEEAKVLLKICCRLDGDTSILPLIDNPQEFFRGIPIITIKEIPRDKLENDAPNNPPENLSDITDPQKKYERNSGTQFTPCPKIDDWYYIPYNFKEDEKREAFKKELKALGLELSDINADTIVSNEKEIRKAYNETNKKISGKVSESGLNEELNVNSMVLFSGKKKEDTINISLPKTAQITPPNVVITWLYRYLFEEIQSGCLYTGDVDLKQSGIVAGIKNKLNGFYKNIGTLQVPHHGSVLSFNKSIFDCFDIKCAVVSYGTANPYGHPSMRVIENFLIKDIPLYHVTECLSSVVMQIKKIETPRHCEERSPKQSI